MRFTQDGMLVKSIATTCVTVIVVEATVWDALTV
jgi:hypothetical protein